MQIYVDVKNGQEFNNSFTLINTFNLTHVQFDFLWQYKGNLSALSFMESLQ